MANIGTNTPYGRIVAQKKANRWYVAQDFIKVPQTCDQHITSVLQNYASAYKPTPAPQLAELRSVEASRRRCVFMLPPIPGLSPLSHKELPLPPSTVRGILLQVASAIETLHADGFGAFFIGTEAVFCDAQLMRIVLIPTPWLSTVRASDTPHDSSGVEGSVAIAPELFQSPEGSAKRLPVQTDIFVLGALAWTLLTGIPRRQPNELPSMVSPGLAEWDRFIDGCCRTDPKRRFATLHTAVSEIPSMSQATPIRVRDSIARDGGPRRKRSAKAKAWAAVGFVALAVLALWSLSGLTFKLSGVHTARRGFADTIITYRNRSYEGATWRKLKSASAVQSVLAGTGKVSDLRFKGIAGWDNDNYWVVCEAYPAGAYFCSVTDGHWKSRGATAFTMSGNVIHSLWEPRLMAPQDCVWVNRDKLVRVTGKGVLNLAEAEGSGGLLCPVANDLFFVFNRGGSHSVFRVSGDHVKELRPDKHKESFIHRDDNTPMRDYYVSDLRYTASFHSGHAVGLCVPFSDDPSIVAEYRNGLWYRVTEIEKLMDHYDTRHAWFGGSVTGGPRFVVVVGTGGRVVFHTCDGTSIIQNVQPEQASTSLALLRAWGVDETKYWVMDDSGTIWQRQNNEWSVVVRGMYEGDVTFETAWVSPDGDVFAATEQELYRLE